MLYELTTLSLLPNRMKLVAPRLEKTYASFSVTGQTIGCFACEFGTLQRFTFLTAYEDEQAIAQGRAHMLKTDDPYGIGEHLAKVESVVGRPLPFSAPIEKGTYGPLYEIRTYTVSPGGMDVVSNAWSKVIERRNEISPALIVMRTIDHAPDRLIHIWPYATIEQRGAARAQASKEGIWPPPGGGEPITSLQAELFIATSFSDLK